MRSAIGVLALSLTVTLSVQPALVAHASDEKNETDQENTAQTETAPAMSKVQ